MTRRRKRIEKLLSRPARMPFQEVERILLDFGFQVRRADGSHVWFSKPGVGNLPIPTTSGRWTKRVYLDKICTLLALDRIDLDKLDEILGAETEE